MEHHRGVVDKRLHLRPRRRQQRISVEPSASQQRGPVGERARAEADQPLAVEPGEVALV
jgi:hypothetical protein